MTENGFTKATSERIVTLAIVKELGYHPSIFDTILTRASEAQDNIEFTDVKSAMEWISWAFPKS